MGEERLFDLTMLIRLWIYMQVVEISSEFWMKLNTGNWNIFYMIKGKHLF